MELSFKKIIFCVSASSFFCLNSVDEKKIQNVTDSTTIVSSSLSSPGENVPKDSLTGESIEMIKVTQQNMAQLRKDVFPAYKKIFVQAYLPVRLEQLKKKYGELSSVLNKKEIQTKIEGELSTQWDKELNNLLGQIQLQNSPDKDFYLGLIKQGEELVGCVFFLITTAVKVYKFLQGLGLLDSKGLSGSESLLEQQEGAYAASVWHLCVDPKYQSKGRGTRLMLSIFSHRSDVKKMVVFTSASKGNKKAQKFCEGLGFKQQGMAFYHGDQVWLYWLSKDQLQRIVG